MALRLSGLMLVGALFAIVAIAMAAAGASPRARAASGSWTAEYFNNVTLSGAPVLTRDEGPALEFYRDGDEPAPGVNVERFSIRWTRTDSYAAGTYRIVIDTDDGMRVYVDGALVIDAWLDQSPTVYYADINLTAGTHDVRVDYYNNLFQATAFVWIDPLDVPAAPTAVPTATILPAAATGTAPAVTSTTAPVTATAAAMSTAGATRTAAATRTAGASPTVERTATVAGAGSPLATPTLAQTPTPEPPPRIECLWALPDMDPVDAGMQYAPGPGADIHDDDMALVPDADNDASSGIQPPCAGPPSSAPAQPDGVRHLFQVVPNLEDLPEQRRIQLWMAADVPPGGAEIAAFWYVYYPAGSEVGGVASTLVPATDCAAYGSASGPAGAMFEAAVHTGQIAPAAVSDPALGLIARCQLGAKRLYHGEFPLSKDQPCGEYGITAVAVATSGATVTLSATFDVLCVVALRVDFNVVDWGTLTPGYPQIAGGDLLFAPPNDTWPSVKNIGNDGMGLKLRFSTMAGAVFGQIFDEFHACFGRGASMLQCIDPIAAGALASFDADAARTLCANEVGKLDLAVHPPRTAPADVYHGLVTLIGYHIPDRCAGSVHAP